ncbi:hypothetical protein [Bacteroides reticulotermitis]|nr:hypothetical protein [Bacteroides reticulotermitis]MBB4044820.1 amino acid transporter [Bacteroides reticulotermitis]
MIDIEKMVSSLKLATNKSIAEAHQGKVENKHRLIILIVILIAICGLALLSIFTAPPKWVIILCLAAVIIFGFILYRLLYQEEGTRPNFFRNKLGEKKSLYNYKREVMYLRLLLEGSISPHHSNLDFYDIILNRIGDKKKVPEISFETLLILLNICTLIIVLFDFLLNGSEPMSAKALQESARFQAFLLVLKFAIFFFAMCAVVCFLIYRRAKPYIDLHSIISDLRDEDKLKFKKGSHCSNELHLHVSIDTVDKESK